MLFAQAGSARLWSRILVPSHAEGWKIVPLCPFVNAQRARHPEWADAFNL
ncbi:MAG: N-acetyltransferase [Aestuariivita sp.]